MIGIQVKAAREAAGLTQQELAERIEAAQSTISGIETGAKAPSVEMLLRLASALSVSVDTLTRNGASTSVRSDTRPAGALPAGELLTHYAQQAAS